MTFVSITVISTDGETDQSACFPETNTSMAINSSQLEDFLKKEREKKKKKRDVYKFSPIKMFPLL